MSDKRTNKQPVELVATSMQAEVIVDSNTQKLREMLPAHIDWARFRRMAVECVRKTPKLRQCTAVSFIKSVSDAAKHGLEIDGLLGSGYIVPYGDEAHFLPGYKGYLQLCRRSQEVLRVSHGVVHEVDEFRYALGDELFCHHTPRAETDEDIADRAIRYIYVIFKLENGEKHINVWPVAKIRRHMEKFSQSWRWAESGDKNKGGGRRDSTWHNHFAKMGVKTVMIDSLCSGEVPISLEVQKYAVIDRNLDMGIGIDPPAGSELPRFAADADDLADLMEDRIAIDSKPVGSTIRPLAAGSVRQADTVDAAHVRTVPSANARVQARSDESMYGEEVPF